MPYNNERQEYTKQFDRQANSLIEKQQQPFGEAFIKSNSPQNINASRPTRLLPTHLVKHLGKELIVIRQTF